MSDYLKSVLRRSYLLLREMRKGKTKKQISEDNERIEKKRQIKRMNPQLLLGDLQIELIEKENTFTEVYNLYIRYETTKEEVQRKLIEQGRESLYKQVKVKCAYKCYDGLCHIWRVHETYEKEKKNEI